jgi:hypothetical protein
MGFAPQGRSFRDRRRPARLFLRISRRPLRRCRRLRTTNRAPSFSSSTGTAIWRHAALIGASNSFGYSVAVNAQGEALVSGQVVDFAFTFPVTPNSVKANSDVNTGFLVKLDARGEKMLVGIRGFGLGPVAYGPNDEIYVAGAMYGTVGISPTPGAFQSTHALRGCGGTAFIGIACSYQYAAKISADGTRLIYSTFITGAYGARPAGLIIDSDGKALIAGSTNSSDYPVTAGAYQSDYRGTNSPPPAYAPPSSGYLTKLNADGTGSALVDVLQRDRL